jgi:hypothetical protein
MQQPSWKQSEVFPIIARVMGQEYQQHQRYITTHEIALRLLQDTEARATIEAAQQQQDEKQSLEWWAHNMVAWFSQRITVGQSEWQRIFERTKINGQWAYRPTQPTSNSER